MRYVDNLLAIDKESRFSRFASRSIRRILKSISIGILRIGDMIHQEVGRGSRGDPPKNWLFWQWSKH